MKTTLSKKKKVLLIEDEEHISEALIFNLQKEGMEVITATDGKKAIEIWEDSHPDLVVLDLMLPKYDGYQVLTEIRKKNEKLPILIISAKKELADKIRGFSEGVDDYLTKPFALEEFLLRVHRLLKRDSWREDADEMENKNIHSFSFGPHRVHFQSYEANTPHGTIQLTKQEIDLLRYFFQHPLKVLSRQELLEKALKLSPQLETRTIDNFIVRFRKYFEESPKRPKYFKGLWGRGYLFAPSGKD